MIYFPYPYEDELMYSVFCRYYVHSGCFSHKMALGEILVNRHCNPSKEFLGNLKPEIKEQLQRIQPIEDWVLTHTMMPQYARFIPLERKKSALYHLCHYYKDAHQLFSILPRAESDRYLKYCPMCVDEDREQYGECYWHRIHQIRNIQVCPKHQCMLENSIVTAKSEQAFTFSPAEQYVTSIVPKVMLSSQFTEFSRYMTNVFSAQLDFKSDIPISAVLYNAMLNSKYMKASGQYRNTKQLADDIKEYYMSIEVANISSFYQIQRVLLDDCYDFSTVCQIAFYLGMSVNDLTYPTLIQEQIELERNTHTASNSTPIDWDTLDKETAPMMERVASEIYNGSDTQRPSRVSERAIYRELGLAAHALDNMPLCRGIFEKYTESYEENWARRIVWAYKKLLAENNGAAIYFSDIRRLTGVKKANFEGAMPFIVKYTDTYSARKILEIIK